MIAPDWVCETMADSTRGLDLNGKRPVYAREGIPHLWLVEPTDRTLEAFELQEGQWALIASVKDDDPVSIRPFVRPRESRSRALWSATGARPRPKTGPIGRIAGRDGR